MFAAWLVQLKRRWRPAECPTGRGIHGGPSGGGELVQGRGWLLPEDGDREISRPDEKKDGSLAKSRSGSGELLLAESLPDRRARGQENKGRAQEHCPPCGGAGLSGPARASLSFMLPDFDALGAVCEISLGMRKYPRIGVLAHPCSLPISWGMWVPERRVPTLGSFMAAVLLFEHCLSRQSRSALKNDLRFFR